MQKYNYFPCLTIFFVFFITFAIKFRILIDKSSFMTTSQNTTEKEISIENESPQESSQNTINNEVITKFEPKWFVLKANHKEDLAVSILNNQGIKTYFPTVKTDIKQNGKKKIVERPLIPNTFFAYVAYPDINSLRRIYPFITYSYMKEGKGYKILQIPEREMELFISSSGKMKDDITYFQPGEVELKKGDKVRIIGGLFDGQEGILLKAKGRAKRVFLINFELLGALGTHVEPEYIQILK